MTPERCWGHSDRRPCSGGLRRMRCAAATPWCCTLRRPLFTVPCCLSIYSQNGKQWALHPQTTSIIKVLPTKNLDYGRHEQTSLLSERCYCVGGLIDRLSFCWVRLTVYLTTAFVFFVGTEIVAKPCKMGLWEAYELKSNRNVVSTFRLPLPRLLRSSWLSKVAFKIFFSV